MLLLTILSNEGYVGMTTARVARKIGSPSHSLPPFLIQARDSVRVVGRSNHEDDGGFPRVDHGRDRTGRGRCAAFAAPIRSSPGVIGGVPNH